MKLKRFEGATEQECIKMIREQLGKDALVLNIKKVKPRGLFSQFKKAHVEVMAAYEDKPLVKVDDNMLDKSAEEKSSVGADFNRALKEVYKASDKKSGAEEKAVSAPVSKPAPVLEPMPKKEQKINELEKKLNDTEGLLDFVMNQLSASQALISGKRKYDSTLLQFFHENLLCQEVNEEIIEELLSDIDNVENIDSLDINLIVKIVYNRIIKILGEPVPLNIEKKGEFAKLIAFIGPTGVGKTTTIAKLSSEFIINKGASVAFITADTYRIAAVEQLKVYAEILNCEVSVVYSPEDLQETVKTLRPIYDLVFVDTAGRSHKNKENVEELQEFLKELKDAEIYLVLSITTKYEDLIRIINTYAQIANFKIILTKLDETACLGSILNICHETGNSLSYVSMGQNVPNDLEIMQPAKIAKALLGSLD